MKKRPGLVLTLLLTLTALIWTLNLWKRVETLHLSQSIIETESEYRELKNEEQCLRSRLYRPIDLRQSEQAAQALGMDRPRREQLAEAESVLPDAAVVWTNEKTLTDRLREFFRSP